MCVCAVHQVTVLVANTLIWSTMKKVYEVTVVFALGMFIPG